MDTTQTLVGTRAFAFRELQTKTILLYTLVGIATTRNTNNTNTGEDGKQPELLFILGENVKVKESLVSKHTPHKPKITVCST